MLVVAPHLPLGPGVAHGPQAHEQRLGAGEHERAPQTVDAIAVSHLADAGIAGRERHQLGAPQVQPRRFERRQHAVVRLGCHRGRSRARRPARPATADPGWVHRRQARRPWAMPAYCRKNPCVAMCRRRGAAIRRSDLPGAFASEHGRIRKQPLDRLPFARSRRSARSRAPTDRALRSRPPLLLAAAGRGGRIRRGRAASGSPNAGFATMSGPCWASRATCIRSRSRPLVRPSIALDQIAAALVQQRLERREVERPVRRGSAGGCWRRQGHAAGA